MSVDRTTDEYYLTSSGWVVGTSYYYEYVQGTAIPLPYGVEIVEVWRAEMKQASAFSEECRWVECILRNPKYTEEQAAQLRKKFEVPKGLHAPVV